MQWDTGTASSNFDVTTWDNNKEKFRLSKRGLSNPLDVGKINLEKERSNKDAKHPDNWMMDVKATSNGSCWDSMQWTLCAASVYPPDAAPQEINKEEGGLSSTGQQDSRTQEMVNLGEQLTTNDAQQSFEMMMAKEIASIRNCCNFTRSEKPLTVERPIEKDSPDLIHFGKREGDTISAPDCIATKCEPEDLKITVTFENKDGEDAVLVTQEDSGESAEELEFSSSTEMNGFSQTLNPGRSVIKLERENLTDDGQDQAFKLAKRVEHPPTTQKLCASTESGQSSTDPHNGPHSLDAGKSVYDVWFECYQRYMVATHTAQEVSDSSESIEEFSDSSDSVQHHTVHTGLVINLGTSTKRQVTFSGSLDQFNDSHRTHGVKKTYECPECKKHFLRAHSINQHRRMVHYGAEVYQCTKCSIQFSLPSHLRQHQWKVHKMAKQYSCPYCTETFIHLAQFNKHRRAHTGEVRYECTECNKSFKKESSLNKHQRIHCGEKPFKCIQCNACFAKKGELRKHRKCH